FMGMGEPFLNYDRVMKAASLMNDQQGINIGSRKLTISTSGIIPKIKQFADERQRYNLAISLNASSKEQRLEIMPMEKNHPLEDLMEAAKYYYERSRKHLTFEYVLLDRFNDTSGDAKRLLRLIGGLPCKVNVIPYNDIGGKYQRPSDKRIQNFLKELKEAPFTVTVRWSKGTDIDAGCGQLATKA
ncbi:MAG: radical SAM protein, partial [Candidatus Marinimicrobia bacterium]|nr:radical SAM protein [Candidatus Neomarinimicrobiota bacterium]